MAGLWKCSRPTAANWEGGPPRTTRSFVPEAAPRGALQRQVFLDTPSQANCTPECARAGAVSQKPGGGGATPPPHSPKAKATKPKPPSAQCRSHQPPKDTTNKYRSTAAGVFQGIATQAPPKREHRCSGKRPDGVRRQTFASNRCTRPPTTTCALRDQGAAETQNNGWWLVAGGGGGGKFL
jgi:hypothetical protein